MGACLPKDIDDPAEYGLGSSAHVQRVDCQPNCVDTNHRSTSRNQTPHSAARPAGQVTAIVTAPRRISNWIELEGSAGGGNCTGTNPECFATASALGEGAANDLPASWFVETSASRTHLRSRLAFIPRDKARDAIETLGRPAAAMASALNSSLWERRRRRSPEDWDSLVCTCPPSFVDTSILGSGVGFKMTWPDAYFDQAACGSCWAPSVGDPSGCLCMPVWRVAHLQCS